MLTGSASIPPHQDHGNSIRKAIQSARDVDWARTLDAARSHSKRFPLDKSDCPGNEGRCPFEVFQHPRVEPQLSISVARLWTGGQGLHGGDRPRLQVPLTRTYCKVCAGMGSRWRRICNTFSLNAP